MSQLFATAAEAARITLLDHWCRCTQCDGTEWQPLPQPRAGVDTSALPQSGWRCITCGQGRLFYDCRLRCPSPAGMRIGPRRR